MSPNARLIRQWFDLPDPHPPRASPPGPPPPPPLPLPGRILWITGPSGSGKSSLLRRIRRRGGVPCVNVNRVGLPPAPVIDCFQGMPLEHVLRLLSRVGLAEVWTWLRHPAQLSAGQRFRLRLAIALHQATRRPNGLLVCDEFASGLDPLAAAVAARCVRRMVTASGAVRAVLAGSRDDLTQALLPDRIIECDFGTWAYKQQCRSQPETLHAPVSSRTIHDRTRRAG